MSAAGSGGGRRLPLYIDILVNGQAQAVGAINQVSAAYGQIGRGAAAASGPLRQTQQALNQTSTAAAQAQRGLNQAGQGAQQLGRGLQPVASSASNASRGMQQLNNTSRASVGSMGMMGGATDKLNHSMVQLHTQMSRGRAIRTAFTENMRGMMFGGIGLFGAVNEAVFMIESFTNAQAKHAAAQAQVNALVAAGQKGTDEYTAAMKDLEQASRGLNFTQRIMTQSIFDIVSFSGFMVGAFANMITRSKELRTVTNHLTNATTTLTQAQVASRIASGQQLLAMTGTGKAARLVTAELTATGAAAAATGANVKKMSVPLANIQKLRTAGVLTEVGNGMFLVDRNAKLATGSMLSFGKVFGIVAIGVLAVVGAIVALYKNIGGIRDAARGFVDWIQDMVSSIPGATAAIEALVGAYKYLEGAVIGVLSKIPMVGDLLGLQSKSAEGAAAATGIASEAAEKHNEAMGELAPVIQQVAQAWGVYEHSTFSASAAGQSLIAGLGDMQGRYEDVRQQTIELATANGVDLKDALAMTDQQMLDFMLTTDELGPTMEMAAEQAKESAEAFAEAWMASFEEIKAGQEEFGGNMASAMTKMGQEFGEEMEVGLSDIEKKVSKGAQGIFEQFKNEIFPEDFLATAFIEGNDPEDIIKEMKDFKKDIVKEDLISKEEASSMFDPFISFMKHELPRDTEQAMGYLVGRMPHELAKMEPVIVNGVQLAGGAARGALKTMLVDPFIADLAALESGMSGIEIGRGLLDQVESIMPQLEQQFPQIAGLMQQTLDNSALTTDQKVQEIIGYLGQISPAWEAEIMKMDKDGDQIADIVDNQILSKVDEIRVGMLLFWRDMAEITGNTSLFDAITEKINEITTALNPEATAAAKQLRIENAALAREFNLTAGEVDNLRKSFDGFNEAGEGITLDEEWKTAIDNATGDTKQWLIDTYEEITGHDLFEDGVEIPLGDPKTEEWLDRLRTSLDPKKAIQDEADTLGEELGFGTVPDDAGTPGDFIEASIRRDQAAIDRAANTLEQQVKDAFASSFEAIRVFVTQTAPAVLRGIGGAIVGGAQFLYDTFTDPAFQQQVIGGITWLLQTAGQWLGSAASQVGQWLWDGLVASAPFILDLLLGRTEFQQNMRDGLIGILRTAGSWLATNAVTVGGILWDGLIDTAEWLFQTFSDPEFQQALSDGIEYVLGTAYDWISTHAATVGEALWGGLTETAGWISSTLQDPDFHNAIKGGLIYMFNALGDIFGPIGERLWSGLVNTAGWISSTLQDPAFHQAIFGGLTYLFNALGDVFGPVGEALWSGLVNTAGWISSTLQDPAFHSAISGGLTYLFNALGDVFGPVGEYLWSGLVNTAGWIASTLQDPAFHSAIVGGLTYLFNSLGEIFGPVGEQLWAGLVATAGWISSTLQDPAFHAAISGGLTYLFNSLGALFGPVGEQLWAGLVQTAGWIASTLQDPAFHQAIVGGLTYLFNSLGEIFGPIGEQLWAGLVQTTGWIASTLQDPAFHAAISGGLTYLFNSLGEIFGPLGEQLWAGLVETADYIKTTLENPAFQQAFIEGVAAVIGSAGQWVISNARTLAATFQTGFNNMVTHFPGMIGAAIGTLTGTLGRVIVQGLAAATRDLPERFGNFIKNLPAAAGHIKAGILSLFTQPASIPTAQEFGNTVQQHVAGFTEAFGKAFSEAFGPEGVAAAEELAGNVNEIGAAISAWLTEGVGAGLAAFVASIDGLFTDFESMATELGQQLTSVNPQAVADGIYNFLVAGWDTAWASFTGFLSGKAGDIAGIIQGLFTGGGSDKNYMTPASSNLNANSPGTGTGPYDYQWSPDQQQQGGGDNNTGFGDAMAQSLTPAIQGLIDKITELVSLVKSQVPTMEAIWTSHFTNTTAQTMAFVTGPLTTLAQAYMLYQQNVVPILQQMELAWTMHLANNTGQIMAFITGPLTTLAQAYMLYQANVVPILQQMELAWTLHLQNNTAQIMTFIMGPLTTLAQAYMLYQSNVVPILHAMELAWTMHLANNGAQIMTFVTGPLTTLAQAYMLYQTNVVPIIQAMELAWTMHMANTGAQLGEFIAGPLTEYINAMPVLAQNVIDNLAVMNFYWSDHYASAIVGIDALILAMGDYQTALQTLATEVHSHLENANQNWAAHVDHVAGLIDDMIGHIQDLASEIESAMSDIASSMGEAESAAQSLKAAIDALESKTITITTVFRTQGRPSGGGGMQSAQHGFEGIVQQPTRFLVGEGNQPEFVSVTPLIGRNARGNSGVRNFFDSMESQSLGRKHLERAGSGGIGSSKSMGPANSGLKRPDITRANVRRKTTLNPFFEDVLTYEEEHDYKKLLKKLKKKKWKVSRLNDEDEDRFKAIEDKIIQARFDQIEAIKSAMEQVIPAINLTTDLKSDEELEKWVSTVIPPLSAAPLSMEASSVRAMAIRGRYQHHRDAMKAGRRDQLSWLEQEYERQQRVIEEAEERRLQQEEEKDEWLAEHGSKKQKKAAKKRIEKRKAEQRRKLLISRSQRRDFAYAWSAERYYKELARQVEPPIKIPLPPDESGVNAPDPSTLSTEPDGIDAKRGFSGIIRGRTNITAGEFGKPERVDITPLGEETKNIAKEVRQEIRHFVTGHINNNAVGGNSQSNRQVVYVNINQPLEVKLNEQVIANAVNKSLVKVMSGKR